MHFISDFILAWESDYHTLEDQNEDETPKSKHGRSTKMHRVWRERFLNKLQMKGLKMEKVDSSLMSLLWVWDARDKQTVCFTFLCLIVLVLLAPLPSRQK